MATKESRYDVEQARGNTEVPYLSNPTLTGNARRNDPDLAHNYPYVPGLTDSWLTLEVSRVPADIPLQIVHQFTLAGSADSFKLAIEELNAIGSDIQAIDAGGYLQIISQHPGYDNYVKIVASSSSPDAAPLLGLACDPMPGSISYAGEVESTPPGPSQPNPPGTKLIGRDEDLTSSSINRAIVGVQSIVDRYLRELDRELIGVHEFSGLTVTKSAPDCYVTLPDGNSGYRLPIKALNGSSWFDGFSVLASNGELLVPIGGGSGASGETVRVVGVFSGGPPFYNDQPLDTWGGGAAQGGKFVLADDDNSSIYQVLKQVAVIITEIHGNIVVCPSATFVTNYTQPGDTVVLEDATNFYPFNHNGEYIVDRVLSETQLALRPKSDFEELVFAGLARPTRLNEEGTSATFGKIKVPIGFFLPMKNLRFKLNTDIEELSTYKLRSKVAQRVREIVPESFSTALQNNSNTLGRILRRHVDELESGDPGWDGGPALLHHANKVISAALPDWFTGEHITYGRVQDSLDNIIYNLCHYGVGPDPYSGAERVGSKARAGTPRSLTNPNSISGHLLELLTYYNNHVYLGTADRHEAVDIDKKVASNNWADGTNIGNNITVQAAINNIVAHLATSGPGVSDQDGAKRVGFSYYTLSGKTLNQGSVRSAITDLLTHVVNHINQATGAHAATAISYAGGGTWADGTTNPATSVEGQLDKIITDLAWQSTAGGEAKVGAGSRTNFSGNSVQQLFDSLDSNAAFKAQTNYFTSTNYFREIQTQGYRIYTSGGQVFTGGGNVNGEGGAFISDGSLVSPPLANAFSGKNCVQAWVYFQVRGGVWNAGGGLSVLGSWNFASFGLVAEDTLQVNWSVSMPSAYAVLTGTHHSSPWDYQPNLHNQLICFYDGSTTYAHLGMWDAPNSVWKRWVEFGAFGFYWDNYLPDILHDPDPPYDPQSLDCYVKYSVAIVGRAV